MIEIGTMQKLLIAREVDFGVYLAEKMDAGAEERILLPKSQVPEGSHEGDAIEVFVYKDSKDRPIATTNRPDITLGRTAVLKVKEVNRIGAFLSWGLEKDLLLPYHEQTVKVKPGDEVLCALYLDKSQRLCATMKVYHYLQKRSPYVVGDEVRGRVYERSERFGVFVAVDDRFSALIPAREAQGEYAIGSVIPLRVTDVKEDGKLTVTGRQKAYIQLHADGEIVLKALERCGGMLPFDDKAAPEVIAAELGLSKNAFKRAVGHLMKEGKAEIRDGHIYKK